ncbi:MAG: DNA translocase FtsK 4TM domain-containing protein [Campylobacterales bacterium]|nr:DNA translocase FtsK 4TM domain-containing protein [Campylobacterales bacterium]
MALKIISTIFAFVIVYFSYAVFVPNEHTVGKVGFIAANYLKEYLGYLCYVALPILLYPLYKINFSKIESYIEKTISFIFLALTIMVLQSLIVSNDMSGKVGDIIVESVAPFIGLAGLWIFVLIGFFVSLIILLETKDESIFDLESLKRKFSFDIKLPKITPSEKKTEPKQEKKEFIKPQKIERPVEQRVVIKEVGNTAEIRIEEDVPNIFEPKFKKPQPQPQVFDEDKIAAQEIQTKSPEKVEIEEDIVEQIYNKPIEPKIEQPKKPSSHAILVDELEENKKLLADIEVGEVIKPKNFQLPPTMIFQKPPKENNSKVNEELIDQKIQDLLEKLSMFKIEGDVVRTYTGPIVTTFEFKPAPNVKISKILTLEDDLAMALKATTIRIQAPIPGKDVVGIEVPNEEAQTIYLREILESEIFSSAKSPLTMILGKDIVGKPFITDLKKLPHLLIAGTTGSGKSVGLNSMILSLLYKNSPDNLKLIMIDPKMLEFSIYNDIPHLLTPVITRPTEAINALANMVAEMERRYTKMAETKTKNIENYNEKAKLNGYEEFPYIVIIIDELADLMMTSGKEVELSIARLAQMARASGIHLIVATQRPSVDVVTGLIKANLPSRISYKVGQKVDSKIILDSQGAESLLGRGDMLFTPPGMSGLVRIHAPWSDEKEIEQVVEFLKDQREAQYDISFLKAEGLSSSSSDTLADVGELDELYEEAKLVVLQDQKSSISYIQRRLKIGYNRAASIVEQLEMTGILSEPNSKGNREILV